MRSAHGNSSRLQGRWTGFLIGAGPERARRSADRGGMDLREETVRIGLAGREDRAVALASPRASRAWVELQTLSG